MKPYDNGGALPPGLSAVVNRTGAPVRVLPAGAFESAARRNGKVSGASDSVPHTPDAMRSILEAADAGELAEAPPEYDRYRRAAYVRARAENLVDDAHAITDLGRRMLAILGGIPRRPPAATGQ